MDYFVNSDPTNCKIESCSLTQNGASYTEGKVSLLTNYDVKAVSNYVNTATGEGYSHAI